MLYGIRWHLVMEIGRFVGRSQNKQKVEQVASYVPSRSINLSGKVKANCDLWLT